MRAPTFIVHGKEDLLIPVSHTHRLAAVARDSYLHPYTADHNDCPPARSDHWLGLAGFLRAVDLVRG